MIRKRLERSMGKIKILGGGIFFSMYQLQSRGEILKWVKRKEFQEESRRREESPQGRYHISNLISCRVATTLLPCLPACRPMTPLLSSHACTLPSDVPLPVQTRAMADYALGTQVLLLSKKWMLHSGCFMCCVSLEEGVISQLQLPYSGAYAVDASRCRYVNTYHQAS